MTQTVGSKPVAKYRAGPVSAAVFKNVVTRDGREVELWSVTIDRVFKQGDAFRTTNSFRPDDLPKVALVANLAFEHVILKGENGK